MMLCRAGGLETQGRSPWLKPKSIPSLRGGQVASSKLQVPSRSISGSRRRTRVDRSRVEYLIDTSAMRAILRTLRYIARPLARKQRQPAVALAARAWYDAISSRGYVTLPNSVVEERFVCSTSTIRYLNSVGRTSQGHILPCTLQF